MSEEYLKSVYLQMPGGKKDEIHDLLGSCKESCAFLALKNKYKTINNFFNIFLYDITPSLYLNDDNSIFTMTKFECIGKKYIKYGIYEKTGEDGICLLEELLDRREMVAVHTIYELMPFSVRFDPEFDASIPECTHVFTVVYYDNDHIYTYIEGVPESELFAVYPENRNIGLVDKGYYEKAFKHLCRLVTVSMDEEDIDKVNDRTVFRENIRLAINSSCLNYNKPCTFEKGKRIIYGKQALQRLIQICDEEAHTLDMKIYPSVINLQQLISWKFTDLFFTRKILLKCLREEFSEMVEGELENTLEQSIEAWSYAKNVILKNYFAGRYSLDSTLKAYFEKILEAEDKLNAQLTHFYSKLTPG